MDLGWAQKRKPYCALACPVLWHVACIESLNSLPWKSTSRRVLTYHQFVFSRQMAAEYIGLRVVARCLWRIFKLSVIELSDSVDG